jgi:hypothetical protein
MAFHLWGALLWTSAMGFEMLSPEVQWPNLYDARRHDVFPTMGAFGQISPGGQPKSERSKPLAYPSRSPNEPFPIYQGR